MRVTDLAIPEIKILEPRRFADDRGVFSETYNRQSLSAAGIEIEFVQDNHSISARAGTIRGLHFQTPPFAQDKLVRVIRGRIFDVAVDLRAGSPSYGRYVSAEISTEAWNQILVPKGFAHGFCTLEDDTEVIYKVSDHYAPEHDRGILWRDPDLAIDWPIGDEDAILSDKDSALPLLQELPDVFSYEDG